MDASIQDSKFDEIRAIFNEKYIKGDPLLALVYHLNKLSEKKEYCGCTDERCMAIIEGEVRRVMSGNERATVDDMAAFTRFVTILNNPKSESSRPFLNQGFNAQFFLNFRTNFEAILKGQSIQGVEIGKDGMRINVTGKSSHAPWVSNDAFVRKIVGSDDLLKEVNLITHLSSSREITPIAKKVIGTITRTPVSAAVLDQLKNTGFLPDILHTALVFRALGDNGTLVMEGASRVYHINKSTLLGDVLAPLVADNSFLTIEDGEILLPFGNVSNLITVLFPSQRDDKGKPKRTILGPNENALCMANAVAFRFESSVISRRKGAEKASQ